MNALPAYIKIATAPQCHIYVEKALSYKVMLVTTKLVNALPAQSQPLPAYIKIIATLSDYVEKASYKVMSSECQ